MAAANDEYIRPTPPSQRAMSSRDMALLWMGMVVNFTTYYLAGSLVDLGMSWWQGILTIVLGNSITLLPLLLTSSPGVRYGLPFPVLLRSAFGPRGALVPALLRSLVSCGWCGIESWIGARALSLLLFSSLSVTLPMQFACFLLFSLLQLAILWKGMPAIRLLANLSSPVLALLLALLFSWSYSKAGGFGQMFSVPSRLSPSEFSAVFLPSLTACIGTWAAISLNIPDFTRYCRTQRDQIHGQLGLPLFMGLFTFFGLAITSSTQVIFGRVIANPIDLLAEINGGPFVTLLGVIGISLATASTNIPANFVATANVLVSLSPSRFSFLSGCVVTGIVGVGFMPWRILGSSENFVYAWLVGYSAVLGPITGILLTDYYVVKRTVLDVDELYSESPGGAYYYWHGFNLVALGVLVACVVPMIPGFLLKVRMIQEAPGAFVAIYANAWLFGTFSAAVLYWLASAGWGRWKKGSSTTAAAAALLDDPLLHTLE